LLKKEVPSTVLKELFGKFPKNHQLIFCGENSLLKKEVPSTVLRGTLWKISQKSPYFVKEI
jgi:hypothetical protein